MTYWIIHIKRFVQNGWCNRNETSETIWMDRWITGSLNSFKNWFIHGMKHRVAMHCCIKLIAHLCWRPRAHVLIYRKVHCLCSEYKNVKTHTWVFFVSLLELEGHSNCILMGFIAQWMLLDSQDVFFFFSSQSWIISALLSSLSPSQSHMHYVRRMSLNSNQGKIIPFVVVFLKNFKSCTWTILREKITKFLPLVRSLLQYTSILCLLQ